MRNCSVFALILKHVTCFNIYWIIYFNGNVIFVTFFSFAIPRVIWGRSFLPFVLRAPCILRHRSSVTTPLHLCFGHPITSNFLTPFPIPLLSYYFYILLSYFISYFSPLHFTTTANPLPCRNITDWVQLSSINPGLGLASCKAGSALDG